MGEAADEENTNLPRVDASQGGFTFLDLLLDLRKHKKPPWVVFCLGNSLSTSTFLRYGFLILRNHVAQVLLVRPKNPEILGSPASKPL